MTSLSQLNIDIETRVLAIRANRPDWPCEKGCDNCCRRLAEVPQLTAAEWDFLREGLAALTPDRLADVSLNIVALADQQSRPIICPMLDQAAGACLIYGQRPVACRTYGFYAQRDMGLYCNDIESRVADGVLNGVIWGNHDGIDHRLKGLGEIRTLIEWFECWTSRG